MWDIRRVAACRHCPRWRCAIPALKFGSMDQDSTDSPKAPGRRGSEPASQQPDLSPQEVVSGDIDPATSGAEEDDEARLPEAPEEPNEAVPEGRLAVGHAAIEHAGRHAPTSPGVYRMLNAANDVLYVGKAKNVRKRLASYARIAAVQPARTFAKR